MAKKQRSPESEKTNVIRLLEQHGIPHTVRIYADTDAVAGLDVASVLGENPNQVCKTLVTTGKPGCYYVFVLPVNRELQLKKAAKVVGEKSIAMLKAKDLLPLTGYVHGGCSPIGMKRLFPTVVDASVEGLESMYCSGGKIGWQIQLAPEDLQKLVPFTFADITE